MCLRGGFPRGKSAPRSRRGRPLCEKRFAAADPPRACGEAGRPTLDLCALDLFRRAGPGSDRRAAAIAPDIGYAPPGNPLRA
jgi:hypothetical protein